MTETRTSDTSDAHADGATSVDTEIFQRRYLAHAASQLPGRAAGTLIAIARTALEFGTVRPDGRTLTSALLVGSIPGAYLGARLSTRLPGALIRRALAFVLLASALKLLGLGTAVTAGLLIAVAVLAGPTWMLLRRRNGFPALPRRRLQLAVD